MVLFRSVRDQRNRFSVASQVFPSRVKSFLQVFRDATLTPFSYLFLSFDNQANPIFMVRSKIFYPLGDIPEVYC